MGKDARRLVLKVVSNSKIASRLFEAATPCWTKGYAGKEFILTPDLFFLQYICLLADGAENNRLEVLDSTFCSIVPHKRRRFLWVFGGILARRIRLPRSCPKTQRALRKAPQAVKCPLTCGVATLLATQIPGRQVWQEMGATSLGCDATSPSSHEMKP